MCYVCLVGSSEEDGLRLRQRLSSVPGRTRPSAGGAFAPCLIAVGPGCGFGWRRSPSRPLQEGVVFAISGRHGLSTRLASVATPGYRESPERYSVFHPNNGFVPAAAAPVLNRHDGDGGEANGRNFRRRRSSLPSVSSSTAVASS